RDVPVPVIEKLWERGRSGNRRASFPSHGAGHLHCLLSRHTLGGLSRGAEETTAREGFSRGQTHARALGEARNTPAQGSLAHAGEPSGKPWEERARTTEGLTAREHFAECRRAHVARGGCATSPE